MKFKTKVLACCSIVLLLVTCLFIANASKEKHNASATSTTVDNFDMVDGVSFRMKYQLTNCGIIYTATMPSSTYSAYSSYSINLFVVPYSYVTGLRNATASRFATAKTRGHIFFDRYFKSGTTVNIGSLDTSVYKWAVFISPNTYNNRMYITKADGTKMSVNQLVDTGWRTNTSYTTEQSGFIGIDLIRVDEATLTVDEILSFFTEITVSGNSASYDAFMDGLTVYDFSSTGYTVQKYGVRDFNVSSVNHRGYNGIAPENTLSAYTWSKLIGFDQVECDVSFTSDGYKVLLHDSTVDRTSDGTGSITSLTYAYVRNLSFGSWLADYYAAEQIPSFDEFLEFCKDNDIRPYIEIKSGGTSAQHVELINAVIAADMQDNVAWISFDHTALATINSVYSKATLGFLVNASKTQEQIDAISAYRNGENVIFLDSSVYDDDMISKCKAADYLPLEVWTKNLETTIIEFNGYISGVTSDSKIAEKVLKSADLYDIVSR